MLKKAALFFLNSYLFLAISATVFVFGVNKNYSENLNYSLGVFFAVLGIYNLHRLIKMKQGKLQYEMSIWAENNLLFLWVSSVFGIVVSVVFFVPLFLEKLSIITLFAILLVIAIAYVLLKIREIPLIKAVIVAFSWMMVSTVIPDFSHHSFQISSCFSFFLFLGLTILADIKDLNFDAKSLKTIPQIIGINAAFSLSFLLVLSFVFLQMKGINASFFLQIIGLFWIVFGFIFYKRNSTFRLELLDGILLVFGLTFWLF